MFAVFYGHCGNFQGLIFLDEMLNNVTFTSPHRLQSDVIGSSTLLLTSKWVGTKMDIFPERCRGRRSENLENLK